MGSGLELMEGHRAEPLEGGHLVRGTGGVRVSVRVAPKP